ncbi:MAG: thioredoxin family protein [Flavisolibacter sp.]
MKKLILVSILSAACLVVFAQNRKVDLWDNVPLDKVLAAAKKENKLVFLDFGSPQCKPCLYMKKIVFTVDSVADFVNQHFVSSDYQLGAEKERLSKLYGVDAEPVFLILDTEGNLLHRTQGKSSPGEMLERFRQAMDMNNNMRAMNLKYEKGDRSPKFIESYVNTLHIAGLSAKKEQVLKNIFPESFDRSKLLEDAYWKLYLNYDEAAYSKQTLYVMDHIDTFMNKFGKNVVNSKIGILYASAARVYIFGKKAPVNDPNFEVILRYAQKSDHPQASDWLAYLVPAQYKFSNWVKMTEKIEEVMALNILKGDGRFYFKKMMAEQLAWYSDDVEALASGVKWINELLPTVSEDRRENLLGTKQMIVKKIGGIYSESASL